MNLFCVACNEPFRFLLCQHRYEWEEQRYSADERRDGFFRNDHEPLEFRENRNERMDSPRRKQYSPERDIHRQRSSRSMSREDMRGGHFEENRNNDFHEERRSPFADDRPNFNQYRDRPANRGGPRGNFNRRGRFYRRGRGWPRGNRPQSQRVQNLPNESPQRFTEGEEFFEEPEPAWEQREVDPSWEDDEDRGREMGNSPREDLETQLPQEQWGRNKPKPNMMVITEETLTIKVDMSRPVNKNR